MDISKNQWSKDWKVVKVVKVEKTIKSYWKCRLCTFNSRRQQIKLHLTRWHYPLITYPSFHFFLETTRLLHTFQSLSFVSTFVLLSQWRCWCNFFSKLGCGVPWMVAVSYIIALVQGLKGVSSKPSGKYNLGPDFCFFWVRDLKFWLLAYFLILLSWAKYQQDWTTLILDIL